MPERSAHSWCSTTSQGRRLRPGPGQDPRHVAADQRARLIKAMTEMVYEAGYPGTRVAAVLKVARVSKPTFYELFAGKEDLFNAAYDDAALAALDCIRLATAAGADRRSLIGRIVDVFCSAVVEKPDRAYLCLWGPHSVGPTAMARMRSSEADFAALIQRRLMAASDPVHLPDELARGVVAGIGRSARLRLTAAEPASILIDVPQLAEWILAVSDLDRFDAFVEFRRTSGTVDDMSGRRTVSTLPGSDDRSVLLNAAMRLTREHGFGGIDSSKIAAAAGLPRTRFDGTFGDLSECFTSVLEINTASMIAAVKGSPAETRPTGPGTVGRGISRICHHLAHHPGAAKIFFVDAISLGGQQGRRSAGVLTKLAKLLRNALGTPDPGELAAEAAVGAIWSLMRSEVENGDPPDFVRLAPLLEWLALAPWAAGSEDIANSREAKPSYKPNHPGNLPVESNRATLSPAGQGDRHGAPARSSVDVSKLTTARRNR